MKWLWLSGLGIALLCIPSATFDGLDRCSSEQLLGEWYTLAFATNCDWTVEHLIMEITMANITKLEDGSFKAATNFYTKFGCLDMEMIYTKQENGMYIYKNDWGDKIVESVRSDCKTYIITGTRDLNSIIDDKICKFVALYARTMFVSQSVEQLFEDQAAQMQVERDHIFYLAKKLACTEKGND